MTIRFSPPKIWQKKHFKLSRRELLIIFSFLAVMMVERLFPVKSIGESFWLSAFLFFVFPVFIIKFLLKEPLANFGMRQGNPMIGIILAISLTAIAVITMSLLIRIPALRNQINLLPGMVASFWYFFWVELTIVPMLFFSREFFFRGFIQLGLKEELGNYALWLQAVLFAILFVRSSWLELAYAFFSALAAGFVVKFSRSIYYSFPALWIISLIIDIIIIRLVSQGI